MVEWFLIALPVVFLLGWFAARLDIRHIRKAAGELPRAYLRGLNHLLRGEKNRALDWFLRAEPLDPESAELQFAIGELSRNRGEHRRAIKVHGELCERESLLPDDRMRARWALAEDYFGMGFFDLAEQHAEMLANESGYEERAAAMLLDIHQRGKDFARAFQVLHRMPDDAILMRRKTHAHLLCECANKTNAPQDFAELGISNNKDANTNAKSIIERKQQLLKAALEADGQCARANIMLGDLALAEDAAVARDLYMQVERQNPAYLWLAVSGFLAAHAKLSTLEQGAETAKGWLAAAPSAALFDAVYQQLSQHQLDNMATALAQQWVVRKLPAAVAAWANEQSGDADFWQGLSSAVRNNEMWRCNTCGYKTSDFVWQCHNCLEWESLVAAA